MGDIQSAIFTDMWLHARFNGGSDQFEVDFLIDEIPGADEKGSVTFTKYNNSLEYQFVYNLKHYPIEKMLSRLAAIPSMTRSLKKNAQSITPTATRAATTTYFR